MNAPPQIFDRKLHRLRRRRARQSQQPVTFLEREVEERLLDRLMDIRRTFKRLLLIGPASDSLLSSLRQLWSPELIVVQDELTASDRAELRVNADAEALPFAPEQFDAVLSLMVGHWINDLPGFLLQSVTSLKPDGLLLMAFPGGESLRELRYALTQAELAISGGAAARVSPFVDVRDAGRLLQRVGLALPVADFERINVSYRSPVALRQDLRGMGESACFAKTQRRPLTRSAWVSAEEIYHQNFALDSDRIAATFDIVFVTGWKPHPDQPSALQPGSARFDLAEAAKATKKG